MDRIQLRTIQPWELWWQCSSGLQSSGLQSAPRRRSKTNTLWDCKLRFAVASLKNGKSSRVDIIPAKFVQAGGGTITDVLIEIYNRIWRTGERSTQWSQLLFITLPIKGNLQLCQKYRTISLISHSKSAESHLEQAQTLSWRDTVIAEDQAGFRLRARRSTIEKGPVVQSIVSLTSSLRGQLVKYFTT